MDFIGFAEFITGIATIIVALVLIYQLRIQHKDSIRDFSYQQIEGHINRMSVIYSNSEFREIFAKRDLERKNISDEDYLALDYYFRVLIAYQNTKKRLGGDKNSDTLKFLLNNVIMSSKIGRFWYKDFGTNLLSNQFHSIADEIYNKYESKDN